MLRVLSIFWRCGLESGVEYPRTRKWLGSELIKSTVSMSVVLFRIECTNILCASCLLSFENSSSQ